MNINGVEIEIKKNWYNKTKVQDDGITHVVDPTQYTVYQFGMAKNYFMENRIDVLNSLISDLEQVTQHLIKMRDKELNQEMEK